MEVMFMLTSSLGICQQRTDFGNLEGIVRLIARLLAHFLVGSQNIRISRFTYQTHRLIRLTPFLFVLLFVGLKIPANWGVRLTTPDVLITRSTNCNPPKDALRCSLRCHKVRQIRSELRRADICCSTQFATLTVSTGHKRWIRKMPGILGFQKRQV